MTRFAKARWAVRWLPLVVVALASGLFFQQTAFADDPTVPTGGVVIPGGPGATMIIECKWELPDMTPNDTVMTYGVHPAPHDDTPAVLPTGTPCTPPPTGVAPPPMQNKRQHMMGIRPNTHDQPILRQYEKWMAVYSTAVGSIIDVYWKVWEPYIAGPPGGPNCANPVSFEGDPNPDAEYCFKYQHHATMDKQQPSQNNPIKDVPCADLQSGPMTAMFHAAVETGQMHPNEPAYMIDKCFQNEKRVFRVQEDISKEQPCGEYRVEATVVNSAAVPTRLVDFFDVLCFRHLALDFNGVAWGQILNFVDNYVSGDFSMATPQAPTVQNQGNDPLYVEVHFSPLVLQSDPTKEIRRFDAKLRASWQTNPASITEVPILMASWWYCFGNHPIVHNQTAKLDLSVHPEGAELGVYLGTVNVVARGNCAAPHAGIHQAGHP